MYQINLEYMKKHIMSLFLLVLSFHMFAQITEPDKAELEKRNWQHQNFAETGIYGIGTDAAIEFLKSKGLTPKTVVVGVLDSGIEIDHEDLKNNIWVNPKEVANNGKDDDKNGYVDDIYGWDFNVDGKNVDYNDETYEATRVVKRFMPLFASANKRANVENMKKMPAEYQEYLRARKYWAEKYYGAQTNLENLEKDKKEILPALNGLKSTFQSTKLSKEYVQNTADSDKISKTEKEHIELLLAKNVDFEGHTLAEIIDRVEKRFNAMQERYEGEVKYAFNLDFDPTDGRTASTPKGFGNNEVEGPDAFHGTHVAGIIGAERNNGLGMNGVAGDVVKLMSVRMVPNGDERDLDVALGIRYAVDNGAKVLNMSFGKGFSPDKKVVMDAIKYADRKGVLMFHAAGNDNKDLDFNHNYPSNFNHNEMKNLFKHWITVGASTRDPQNLKARFSNYGTMKVDIFAPGTEIYSTIQDNTYRYAQGTSMASPVAAGAAALIWAYFPHMKAHQVKEVLFESVNKSDQISKIGSENDERKFSDLSATGGVIDVNKAVRLAYERYGRK